MNRGVIAGIVAGVVVGLVIAGLVVMVADGDGEVTVVDPGSAAENDAQEVVTRWAGLAVSADRRTVSVSTAAPLDPCAEMGRLVLEIREGEEVVVVRPTFVVPPPDDDTECTAECAAIEMSATAPEAIPEDFTFVSHPDAAPSCAEGVPLDT